MYGALLVQGWASIVLAFLIPFSLAVVWGVFNVPNDPSRSGNAPVVVPGLIRLILELVVFGFGVFCLHSVDFTMEAFIYSLFIMGHYLFSYNRILWLIKQ